MHEVILSPSHIDDVGSAHLASSLTCFPAKMPYYMLCRPWAFAMVTFFLDDYPPWWLKSQNLSEIPLCEAWLPGEGLCLVCTSLLLEILWVVLQTQCFPSFLTSCKCRIFVIFLYSGGQWKET